jgi:hypothetical protein
MDGFKTGLLSICREYLQDASLRGVLRRYLNAESVRLRCRMSIPQMLAYLHLLVGESCIDSSYLYSYKQLPRLGSSCLFVTPFLIGFE